MKRELLHPCRVLSMSNKFLNFEAGLLALGLLMFAPGTQAASPSSSTNLFPTEPLSLADAINLALQQNPSILRGQKDLEATQGIVIQTRAVALPKVNVAGKYSAVEPGAVDKATVSLGGTGFTFGTDQSWSSQIRLTQSLYEGGRIVSSLRAAKLKGELSLLDYQTTVANAVLAAQVAYFAVLLAEQQIIVHEASVE